MSERFKGYVGVSAEGFRVGQRGSRGEETEQVRGQQMGLRSSVLAQREEERTPTILAKRNEEIHFRALGRTFTFPRRSRCALRHSVVPPRERD